MFSSALLILQVAKRDFLSEEYCEDAFAPKHPKAGGREVLRLAVADGATQSAFPAKWAELMAQSFRCKPWWDIRGLQAAVGPAARSWHEAADARPMPWYAQEKLRLGGLSTILGFEARSGVQEIQGGGTWRAVAIGDSCLFQVHEGRLIEKFPIADAGSFDNAPALISTDWKRNKDLEKWIRNHCGRWSVGDTFILATDALAKWFLSEDEAGRCPWEELTSVAGRRDHNKQFRRLVQQKRDEMTLKDDDVTCIVARMGTRL